MEKLISKMEKREADLFGIPYRSKLAKLGSPAVEPLIGKLGDASEEMRVNALWVLGRIGDKRAVPAIVDRLGDQEKLVRFEAQSAIGRLKEHAIAPLVEAANDKDEKKREQAIAALGLLGDDMVIPALIAHLDDPVDSVVIQAAISLSLFGETALDLLEKEWKCETASGSGLASRKRSGIHTAVRGLSLKDVEGAYELDVAIFREMAERAIAPVARAIEKIKATKGGDPSLRN
ncbi:MAG: HEAT repeat domain-containing protein [Candidatus Micrarchaeota archaeon]